MVLHKSAVELIALTILLSGCGPTAGKRLAAEKALKSMEDAYEARNGVLSSTYVEMTQGPIARARQSGDPTRKADVQIDLDLDLCEKALHTWLVGLEIDRLDTLDKKKPDDKEIAERKERNMGREESFRWTIDRLREDLK